MRKSTNFVLVSLASLLLVTIIAQNALAQDTTVGDNQKQANAPKAIPSWIDNNFKWYGEGKIGQGDLLNSLTFMLDNGLMHLSDKAAQEMKNLREENKKMHEMIGQYKETDLDFVSRSAETSDVNDQALHHLRKSYDLNPNLQTKVVQYDDKHEKWIDVLSIDWGGTSEAGDPDRPIIIGRMSAQDATSDMVLKGSKIKENFVDTTRQTPKTDFGTILNSIDTEYKLVSSKVKLMSEISDRVSEITDKDMVNLDTIKKELASLQSKLDALKPQSSEMSQSFNLQYLQLQQNMQEENRQFSSLSNVMKTKHDTAKNAINNVR